MCVKTIYYTGTDIASQYLNYTRLYKHSSFPIKQKAWTHRDSLKMILETLICPTVRSSKYMVFDRKSIPIVACREKQCVNLAHTAKSVIEGIFTLLFRLSIFCGTQKEILLNVHTALFLTTNAWWLESDKKNTENLICSCAYLNFFFLSRHCASHFSSHAHHMQMYKRDLRDTN